jgi:hypothetical protein
MADIAVRFTVNLGPRIDITTVRSAVDDFAEICAFSQATQRLLDRNRVISDLLSEPELQERFGRYGPNGFSLRYSVFADGSLAYGPNPAWLPWFQRAVESELARLRPDYSVRVRELRYSNPLDILAVVKEAFDVLPKVIREIRDFGPERRKGMAEASEYESAAALRNAIRERLLTQINSGETAVSSEQLDAVLTTRAISSFDRLAIAETSAEISEDEAPDLDVDDESSSSAE